MTGSWGRNNGFLSRTRQPLPAFQAYQFGAIELAGAKYQRKVGEFPSLTGYEFVKSDRHVWVLWSKDGKEHTIFLPTQPLNQFTVIGEPITYETGLKIGLSPVYIELPASIPRSFSPVVSKNYASFSNGDFESKWLGWKIGSDGLPVSLIDAHPFNPESGGTDASIPNGGYSILLGDTSYPCDSKGVPLGSARIEKVITIPDVSAGGSVKLEFDYAIFSQDASTDAAYYDGFEVYVLSKTSTSLKFWDGNLNKLGLDCSKWWRVPGTENSRSGQTDGWATGTIDLNAFQGETITISFQNHNRLDGWYNTYTYLDDVRMVIVP
jgi:hypothetical protein